MPRRWALVFALPVLVAVCVSFSPANEYPSSLVQYWTSQFRSAHTLWSFPPWSPAAVNATVNQVQVQSASQPAAGTCHLPGQVDHECCNCTYSEVEKLNKEYVNPIVSKLVKTAFFRYFKVNIYCDCPLWPEDGMCALRACSVCECSTDEVPKVWLDQEAQCDQPLKKECDKGLCAAEAEGGVDQTLDPTVKSLLLNLKGWRGFNNPWMYPEEENEEYQYINLIINPERYTGYQGEHAHRIWNAIYSQSCFDDITEPGLAAEVQCTEKRVFYRLVSGMHASISAHLSNDYLLDEVKGMWGPNITEFKDRLGTPDTQYRVQNLYFAYLFVLRAVLKAAPVLQQVQYSTGLAEEDRETARLMTELLDVEGLSNVCPLPFDEGRLWKGEKGPELMALVQKSFQNITRIMDCVGCEKCKLWGKLQTLGVATALKILFSSSDCGTSGDSSAPALHLERNEVIALLNLLDKFSGSLEIYRKLGPHASEKYGSVPQGWAAQSRVS